MQMLLYTDELFISQADEGPALGVYRGKRNWDIKKQKVIID